MREIKTLRQYPMKNHNKSFQHLVESGAATIDRYQYDALANLRGIPRNGAFLLHEMLTATDNLIILGAEPYDPRVPMFERLASRHDVVLHTSWPYWGTNDVPQPTSSDWLRQRWRSFLNEVYAVGVTTASTNSVRTAGARAATTIPHGVDTDIYHPDADEIVDKNAQQTVLFVGRLEERKGVSELLDVREAWRGPETQFRFVGDGPLAEEVSAAAATNEVVYEGYVSDESRLAALYAAADVLVLPSYEVKGWQELFGIVIIEAMAAGTPVVATDCVGPAEIVDDGDTGIIVPQNDIESLRLELENLLFDDDRRTALSERSREVAESRYDWRQTSGEWQTVFDAIKRNHSPDDS
jgi:glycosyltransferase involved in cell wall biosynthesis